VNVGAVLEKAAQGGGASVASRPTIDVYIISFGGNV
jgi:hypothetical protein